MLRLGPVLETNLLRKGTDFCTLCAGLVNNSLLPLRVATKMADFLVKEISLAANELIPSSKVFRSNQEEVANHLFWVWKQSLGGTNVATLSFFDLDGYWALRLSQDTQEVNN